MKHPTILKLGLTLLATFACGSALAQGPLQAPPWKHAMVPYRAPEAIDAPAAPFYSNLTVDTCTSCNYDATNGFLILGSTNCFAPGSTQWVSYPFVAGHTGVLKKISASITLDADLCSNGVSQFTLGVWSDACNGPAVVLASAKATAPAAPCGLVTVSIRNGPTLTAGTNYWIVAQTVGTPQAGFTGVWWQSNNARTYFNFDDGVGWQRADPGSPGGFSIQ